MNNLNTINLPSSINDFNLGYIEEYKVLEKPFDKIAYSYKKHLGLLLKKLEFKLNKSLYFRVDEIRLFKYEDLIGSIKAIEQHIIKNNDFTKGFQT